MLHFESKEKQTTLTKGNTSHIFKTFYILHAGGFFESSI